MGEKNVRGDILSKKVSFT